MFYVIFYKKYKECPAATTISMVASAAILLGIMYSSLIILAMRESSWFYGNYYIGILPTASFLIVGIYGKIKAPKYAHQVMEKRITEDVEYGRYIANKYPQYVTLVKQLQPLYSENDVRPITNYLEIDALKQAEKNKKRIPLLIVIIIVLLIFIAYMVNK